MYEPGKFRNTENKQLVLFEGMNDGLLCLSSIEACQEYKGKGYIFFILKYGESILSTGQRIMYERIVQDLAKAGKFAIAAIVRHETPQGRPIVLKDCSIASAKLGFNDWKAPQTPTTALGLLKWYAYMIDNHYHEALQKMKKESTPSLTMAGDNEPNYINYGQDPMWFNNGVNESSNEPEDESPFDF